MFFKIILFLVGTFFMLYGNFYIVVYMNLFSFGYTKFEYLEYIFTRYECYCSVIGVILIILAVYIRRR